jgi:hypothetical protein
VYPSSNVSTFSQYLAENRETTLKVVSALQGGGHLDHAQRYVTPDGVVHELPHRPTTLFGIDETDSAEVEGSLPPNEFNVFLFGVIEAIRHQADTVYHLSGPDMAKYVGKMAGKLCTMYDVVKNSGEFDLPERLTMVVVPTAAARFAVAREDQAHLEAMMERYDEVDQTETAWSKKSIDFFSGSVTHAEKKQFSQEKRHAIESSRGALSQAAHGCEAVFLGPGEPTFLSQYDGELYVHPVNNDRPMSELATMYNSLKKRLALSRQGK